jgi:uncharacterized membrane protein YciS (DUF1049 family)
MKYIIISLIVLALATLTIAILNIFCLVPEAIIAQSKMSTLSAISISCGVMIASITYLRDRDAQVIERKKQNDEIMLRLAKQGFDETYDLLKDQNNNRVTWIRAARILYDSLGLKKEIKLPPYVKAFNLAEEKLRNQLYRVLQTEPENPYESGKVSLPGQFFYGNENWKNSELTLDDVAIRSKSPIKAYSVTIDKITPEPKSEGLSESSVVAIYEFLKYPEEYDDPLDEIKLWDGHFHDCFGIEQGPRRYIYHKKNYIVLGGKLINRNKS